MTCCTYLAVWWMPWNYSKCGGSQAVGKGVVQDPANMWVPHLGLWIKLQNACILSYLHADSAGPAQWKKRQVGVGWIWRWIWTWICVLSASVIHVPAINHHTTVCIVLCNLSQSRSVHGIPSAWTLFTSYSCPPPLLGAEWLLKWLWSALLCWFCGTSWITIEFLHDWM